jgi:MFS family permease
MCTFFIPVFAQKLGASFLDIGVIGGAFSFTYALSPMLPGYLAQRINRTHLFSLGTMMIVVVTIALMFAHTIWDIVIARSMAGFAFAFLWPIAEVLVIDLAPEAKRAREVGRYSVSWGSGLLLGPVFGGLIVQACGFTWLFAISAFCVGCSFFLTIAWIVPVHSGRISKTTVPFSSIFPTMKKLLPWYVMILCYGMMVGIVMNIFPGYANSVGIDPLLIGLMFTSFSAARILAFSTSERLMNFGEFRILYVASGILVMGGLILAAFPGFQSFLPSIICIGGCFGAIFPITLSFISRHFPNETMGAAAGSYEGVWGIGSAVGPILAGFIVQSANIRWAFVLISLSAGTIFMITYFWNKSHGLEQHANTVVP